MRFSAPKKGLEMACLPSFEAAMAMTWAEVTTPWPPRPDIRMLILLLIMVDLLMAPSTLRLCQRFLSRRFLGLLFLSKVSQERLRPVRDVLFIGKALAGFLGIAHLLETFHAVLPDLENARRVELQVGRADLASDQDRILHDLLNQWRLAHRAVDYIDTAGLLGDFGQAYFVELLPDRRHLRHETLLHQSALLPAGIGVQLIVEADRRELLLAEPGLQSVVQSDVHRRPVAGQHHDILDAVREAQGQRALQPRRDRVLIPKQRMDVMDRHMREDQAGAPRRPDHDRVFGIG